MYHKFFMNIPYMNIPYLLYGTPPLLRSSSCYQTPLAHDPSHAVAASGSGLGGRVFSVGHY